MVEWGGYLHACLQIEPAVECEAGRVVLLEVVDLVHLLHPTVEYPPHGLDS